MIVEFPSFRVIVAESEQLLHAEKTDESSSDEGRLPTPKLKTKLDHSDPSPASGNRSKKKKKKSETLNSSSTAGSIVLVITSSSIPKALSMQTD